MELSRVYAFFVDPTRTEADPTAPAGGPVSITKDLRDALSRSLKSASFASQPTVNFQVDQTTRTNAVRDAVLDLAFGDGQEPLLAAAALAQRLSRSMDRRSDSTLLVLTTLTNTSDRRIILWLFPRDQAFQFRSGRSGPTLSVLTDVFSQTSRLRKAASFQGRNLRNEFLSGNALDFQAGHGVLDIANFWIVKFLECTFAIQGAAATRLLATKLRDLLDRFPDGADQEQLISMIMALPRSPKRRWSFRGVGDAFLSGGAKDAFIASLPNDATRNATFDFSREEFERILHYRIFQLQSGVIVSSPLDEVGRSVRLTESPKKRLTCTGLVTREKVRSRNA